MKKEFHLTKAGLSKLKTELETLVGRRHEVAEKLKLARSQGDLSENAEYQTAREEQVQVEKRASEIEHILTNADLIEEHRSKGAVVLGSEVVLTGDGANRTLSLVGSVEANPGEQKISDESPLGRALLGKKVGDKVEIDLPAGKKTYTIKSIS